LTPEELDKLNEMIKEIFLNLNHFYKDPGFYIGIGVGIFGIIISYLSFVQAKKAKEAAISAEEAAMSAAQRVKTQEMIIDIQSIISLCNIEVETNYYKASLTCNVITSRIKHLLGYYKNDLNIDIQNILKSVEVSLDTMRSTLNNNNPVLIPNQQNNIENQIYYSIEPLFTSILGNLGLLQGLLENQSLNN
jgi:hypothetical protein